MGVPGSKAILEEMGKRRSPAKSANRGALSAWGTPTGPLVFLVPDRAHKVPTDLAARDVSQPPPFLLCAKPTPPPLDDDG